MPFIGPIENAIYHLIGYSSENKLEVDKYAFNGWAKKEGYLVVVAESGTRTFQS